MRSRTDERGDTGEGVMSLVALLPLLRRTKRGADES